MCPQSGYLTCLHSAHVYHSLAAIPSENDGECISFIGNRTVSQVLIPIKLPSVATFKWKQVNAVDDPTEMQEAYKDETPGWLWTPEDKVYRQPFNVPRILVLPAVGFKIFHLLGSKVMPHELQAAIKRYLTSDTTELANNNSWGLVFDWLLCAGQAEN